MGDELWREKLGWGMVRSVAMERDGPLEMKLYLRGRECER